MATAMKFTEEQEGMVRVWNYLDDELRKRGIFHGLPVNLGEDPITTREKWLQDILNAFPETQNRSLEEAADQFPYGTVIASWETSRPWKGLFGSVIVYRDENGKVKKYFLPYRSVDMRHLLAISTVNKRIHPSTMVAEQKARQRLRRALTPHQWLCYNVGDGIMEEGKSGVVYILRRNRPTIALRLVGDAYHPLCALCLHPLGYYTGTWAGVMAPSDEVLAHLLMIRSDEHYFWRKANQIPLEHPQSGV